MSKKFELAPLDWASKIITVSMALMWLTLLYGTFVKTYLVFMFSLITFIFFICFLYSPVCYEVAEKSIVIHRRWAMLNTTISGVERIGKVNYRRTIRTFAVGGFFGYFGWYNGNELWAVSNQKYLLRIETDKKIYVISPKKTKEFVDCFVS